MARPGQTAHQGVDPCLSDREIGMFSRTSFSSWQMVRRRMIAAAIERQTHLGAVKLSANNRLQAEETSRRSKSFMPTSLDVTKVRSCGLLYDLVSLMNWRVI